MCDSCGATSFRGDSHLALRQKGKTRKALILGHHVTSKRKISSYAYVFFPHVFVGVSKSSNMKQAERTAKREPWRSLASTIPKSLSSPDDISVRVCARACTMWVYGQIWHAPVAFPLMLQFVLLQHVYVYLTAPTVTSKEAFPSCGQLKISLAGSSQHPCGCGQKTDDEKPWGDQRDLVSGRVKIDDFVPRIHV